MEHLQKELDDMHPENVTDLQKFEAKIKESGMNDIARKEAEKVLNRLRQEGQQSVESGILYDYLDFVTGLSWKKEDAKNILLSDARKILDEDHYGLKKVKERIIQQIAVMNLKKKQSGSILLFVGAPGTGKTSIGKSASPASSNARSRYSTMASAIISSVPRGAWFPCCSSAPTGIKIMVFSLSTCSISRRVRSR